MCGCLCAGDEDAVKIRDGGTKSWPLLGILPPALTEGLPVLCFSLWPNLVFDDLHELGPGRTALLLTPIKEIDHVAVVALRGAIGHLGISDKGADHFSVSRFVADESSHFGHWRGNALGISVVKCEPHPEHDAPLEALSRISG